MVQIIKKIATRLRVDDYLRYSAPYRRYLQFRNSPYLNYLDQECTFYSHLLSPHERRLVFDIGANKGDKTEIFLRLGARVIAVEPERKNLRTLTIRFRHQPNVTIVGKAISDAVGTAQIYIEEEGSGFNTLSKKWKGALEDDIVGRWARHMQFKDGYEVPTTTLDELIAEFGVPDFAKIDVEGFEKSVLAGLSKKIPLLSFEANLPEFKTETLECMGLLRKISKDARFGYWTETGLQSERFAEYDEFCDFLSGTQLRYMEIFCRM